MTLFRKSIREIFSWLGQRPATAIPTWLALVLVIASGCSQGPAVGQVEGTVTVDGEPVPGLKVFYHPPDGRPSRTVTDSAGHYKLKWKPEVSGALVGQHKVVISTITEQDRVEHLPARYNSHTELTADVKRGDNVIDFPLESK